MSVAAASRKAAPGYGRPDAPGNSGAVTVHQDAAVYVTLLDEGEAVTHSFRPGFAGYLFVVNGEAHASTDGDAVEMEAGSAAKIEGETELTTRARPGGAELLLVETNVARRER